MAKKNTLYTQSTEMSNVIIETDTEGRNTITRGRELKYNRLISNRNANSLLRKNIVIIDNKDVTEAIIEADNCGNNTVKSFDEYAKEEIDIKAGNIFKDLLIKTRKKRDVENSLIDVYLTEKRESLQEKLKKASEFYKTGLFAKANELYENVLDAIKYDNYPDEFMLNECDILAIKFGLALSKIGVNDYVSLRTAEEILISLTDKHGTKYPSLYYYLAKVYYSLNNYNRAKVILEEGLKILDSLDYLTVINWPGTKDNMTEKSTKTFLEQNMLTLINKCKIFHLSDAKCFFPHCEENNNIFFASPLFTGYVSVKCTNKCNFTYHRFCWKRKLKLEGVKKPNSILDQLCTTDDCFGLLYQIVIFDDALQVLSTTSSTTKKDKNEDVKNGCKITLSKVEKSKTYENKKKGEDITKNKQSEKDGNIGSTSVTNKLDLSSTDKVESALIKLKSKEKCQQKKFTFNTNAKEYVPSNFKLHNINISNNLIQIDEENTEGDKLLNSNLNTNAKEYVPPLRVIKMLCENTVTNYCEQSTQTAENIISQAEYDAVKCDIGILQTELFKSEENYNDLLSQISAKEALKKGKVDISTQTEETICENCIQLNSNLSHKDEAYANVIYLNEQLEYKIKELKEEINNLKTAQLLEQEAVMQNEQKLIESNKVLVQKIQYLTTEYERLQNECKSGIIQTNNQIPFLQNLLLEQISYIRNFYLSYNGMFENKCKHMIWELEDIKTLTNADTLPSLNEIEENLAMWRQSLDNAIKNNTLVMIFYDKLLQKFTSAPNEILYPTPVPTLIPEPPSVILRHFKSFFVINKRLENDLNRHMANYYKMISIPYPGTYPINMSQSPIPLHPELVPNSEMRISIESVEAEGRIINPPPGLGGEPVRFIHENSVQSQEEVTEDTKGDILDSSVNYSFHSSAENVSEIGENLSEITENKTTIISYNSAEITNLNETVVSTQQPNEAVSLPVTKQEKENKAVVVGPDRLLFKLQQKYPITPPRILQDAIKTLRDARGGLTGLVSKTLMSELRIIIADLTKLERQKPGYQKIKDPQKTSPWAPINNSVQWQNNNPRGNCAICFEKMDRSNSTQLRCQHVFHTACIKTWLQTDGICPICRSFATLDDEFPPLK